MHYLWVDAPDCAPRDRRRNVHSNKVLVEQLSPAERTALVSLTPPVFRRPQLLASSPQRLPRVAKVVAATEQCACGDVVVVCRCRVGGGGGEWWIVMASGG